MIQRGTHSNEVVQFVCFETSLSGASFALVWKPFAESYVSRGLRQIVLSEQTSKVFKGMTFKYISRNVWLADAFTEVFGEGKIGEGGGGPIRALQGGTFHAHGNAPNGARGEEDKVMGLFRLRNAAGLAELSQTLARAFSALPNVTVLLCHEAAVAPRQRFDLVAEIYSPHGQGDANAAQLETLVRGAIHEEESALSIYRETLVLPTPAKRG